jgi:5'-nucleotidase / UDP-sugar diphosphatase
MAILAAAAGCANNQSKTPDAQVLSPTPVAEAPAPAPEQLAPAPVAETAAPAGDQVASIDTTTPGPDSGMAVGGSAGNIQYTVKPGDTLYHIALVHYGSGKEWKKIAAANPGLAPRTLRAGQTIILP